MNAARTVVLANALNAGGVAAYLARGSDEKPAAAEPVAQLPTTELLVAKSGSIARAPFIAGEPIRSEIILTNIRVLAIDQAPKEKGWSARPPRCRFAASPTSTWSRVDPTTRPRSGAQASTWFATALRANRRHRSDRKDAGNEVRG